MDLEVCGIHGFSWILWILRLSDVGLDWLGGLCRAHAIALWGWLDQCYI